MDTIGVPYANREVVTIDGKARCCAVCPECGTRFIAATSKTAGKKYASHYEFSHGANPGTTSWPPAAEVR